MKTASFVFLILFLLFTGCSKTDPQPEGKDQTPKVLSPTATETKHKIEFVELGSVKCIPCKQMQPVMSAIEKKYKGLVKVTFHDVWKDDAPAKKYGVDVIPTQVFLDPQGKELMRHQGFFAEDEIDVFLKSQGLSIPD